MAGLTSVSGLASGLDWRSLIDQLRAVEHRPIDLLTNRQTEYSNKLKAWQDLNSRLLSLKTAAEKLKKTSDFNLYGASLSSSSTTAAGDLVGVSVGESANPGTYALEILQTARAQKLSSKSFTSQTSALGSAYAGTAIVNGKTLTMADTDTLVDVRDKINNLNSGTNATQVSAAIVAYSASDYRLILTNQREGATGIGLGQVGPNNVLQAFGLITGATTIKNATNDGARSNAFTASGVPVSSLLGLSSSPSGTATIGGQAVTIDLSKSLSQIAADIDALAGVSAEVVSATENGSTVYRIDISGTTAFTDNNNVLQTLGVLKGSYGSAQEIHLSDQANTRTSGAGGGAITGATTWSAIDTGGDANNVTNGDTITITGIRHDGTAVTGTYTINDRTTDTVQGLLTQIETLFGLTAGSAAVTAEGKIQVADSATGDSALSIGLTTHNEGGGTLNLGTLTANQQGYTMELQSGRDARFKVDGNYLSRTSNTISDAIGGVTLNLKKAEEGTTITLNVHRDVDGLTGQIKDFVSKYNEVMDFVKAQMTYDTEAQQPGGILFGDGTLRSVKNDLVALLVSPVSGVSSQFSILGQVGISLDKEGTLTVNESTLKGYLQSNFDDVKKLFAAQGTASVGAIRYVGHGRETKPGTYAVQITQAATRAAVTGTVDLSGGLGGDETLAIAVGSASASINLTAGMSLAQIVTAVNSELGRSFSRSIVGDRVLYADALRTTEISSATTWANVYDDTGTSAGIQDGDVIDFSGVNRSGVAVNGSYTITDAGTATVQGLLSAIETAFGNTVTAQINGDGKIVLTDKNDGTSVSSLEIFNPGGRNLNFGTIDIDPTGADGSREGRYALAVSATASADNKYLVLTQNYYGSAHTFTLAQANDLVLGAGLDGSFSGLDVAGTINGEEATGSGQTLTGKIGAANVDGLVISYSGTAMGSIGTLSLTLGTAELFDRSLFHITDGFEGYVAFKKTSIQNNIESLETKISQKEDLLERKMERLALQFQTMERIVSTLKNQSNWLSSQISSLS